ncbi:MAG: amidase [Dongiaceae bacterium]
MTPDEYARQDAVGLAGLVRRGEATAGELVEAALARMDHVNGRINAVVHRLDEAARAAAAGALPDGPFRGVPFLVKNLAARVAGAPCTMGCRALAGHRAETDSELVGRYRRAGLVFAGITNSPEFGLMGTTEPELYGPTRNPWNLGHSAGGSSGGAAAAVAAGIVPVAHGGDGGGSIRIPASACGLFGLKPSRGRDRLDPDAAADWQGFAVSHVLSRTVRDSAAFLDVARGADDDPAAAPPPPERPYRDEVGRDPGRLRIGLIGRSLFGERTHPDCLAALGDAAALLASLGHEVEEVRLSIAPEEGRLAYLEVVAASIAAELDGLVPLLGGRLRAALFEAPTWFMGQVGRSLRPADLERARATVERLSRAVAMLHARFDLIMTPTLAYPPARIGELTPKPHERVGLALLRRVGPRPALRWVLTTLAAALIERTPNTMLFNMTGQPAMSVPLWWNAAGLPIGTQLAARFGDEATLFRLAGQLEQARPWADRRPPL